jgi:hypothetical protein
MEMFGSLDLALVPIRNRRQEREQQPTSVDIRRLTTGVVCHNLAFRGDVYTRDNMTHVARHT